MTALDRRGPGFPIQKGEGYRDVTGRMRRGKPPQLIPWGVAEVAYRAYAQRYGRNQTLDDLARRGGFGRDELLALLAQAVEDAMPESPGPALADDQLSCTLTRPCSRGYTGSLDRRRAPTLDEIEESEEP